MKLLIYHNGSGESVLAGEIELMEDGSLKPNNNQASFVLRDYGSSGLKGKELLEYIANSPQSYTTYELVN